MMTRKELEQRIVALEAENARLRERLEPEPPDPVPPWQESLQRAGFLAGKPRRSKAETQELLKLVAKLTNRWGLTLPWPELDKLLPVRRKRKD